MNRIRAREFLSICRYVWCCLAICLMVAGGPVAAKLDDTALTAKERLEVFEKVWNEINYDFYDPTLKGVNWQEVHQRYRPLIEAAKDDAEFYRVLVKLAGEVRDAHTRVIPPALLANLQQQKRAGVGLRIEEIEGKPVVTSVNADSEAARAGIEPGMVVLAIDDRNAIEKLEEVRKTTSPSSSKRLDETRVYAGAFGGPLGATLKLKLERADSSTFDVSLTRQLLAAVPKLTTETLPSGYLYIAFDQFTETIATQLDDVFKKSNNAAGLIVDLRNNSGGSAKGLYAIVPDFYKTTTLFLRTTTRRQLHDSPPPEVFLGKQKADQLYGGPVVILVGPRSGSTAELFAAAMQETKRAVVIGSQSCGCAVGINSQRRLKGGGVLEIGEVLWLTPSGRKIEGDGVVPDRAVIPTIRDLQQKRDPVVEAAEKFLQEQSSTNRTGKH